MLIQIDGSHHRWLGEDGLQFTLLIAVDDATGCVAGALFCLLETTSTYFQMLEKPIRRHGVPLSLYADRHSVFKQTPGARRKVRSVTQFARAMDELGIQMVFPPSPQGKGRVEPMAGTFQDRLVSELRLAGASTAQEANRQQRARWKVIHRARLLGTSILANANILEISRISRNTVKMNLAAETPEMVELS